MSGHMQIAFIVHFCETIAPLRDLEFQAYGSLYFADAPLPCSSKTLFRDEYIIGPHCGSRWHGQSLDNQTPCKQIVCSSN
jgi:hypothetical protein